MAKDRTRSKKGIRKIIRAKILQPKRQAGVNPNLFPSCDGRPLAAVPSTEPWIKVKRQFLSAYYRLNCEYARLTALRDGRQHVPPQKERPILQAIERALQVKEALEDRWASRGLVAMPQRRDGIAVNIWFSYPGSPAMRPNAILASAAVKLSFAIPGRPAGRK